MSARWGRYRISLEVIERREPWLGSIFAAAPPEHVTRRPDIGCMEYTARCEAFEHCPESSVPLYHCTITEDRGDYSIAWARA